MTVKSKSRDGANRAALKLHRNLNSISTAIWVLEYSLEEARQIHTAREHFWKQAGACIALALLRLGRLV